MSRMMPHTTVLCTNTISSMVFAVIPWLLIETQLVLEQMQSDRWLVLDTQSIYETWFLLEEICYTN